MKSSQNLSIKMKLMQMESKGRLFVLCNDRFKDDPVYACVQGGHAVAQYFIDNGSNSNIWKNETIVYLWYPEKHFQFLDKTINSLSYKWFEPDQGNILTAVAIWENDILKFDKNILKHIKKLQLVK